MLFSFQKDERIDGSPTKIWVYGDTVTDEAKGDAIVAFENSHDAVSVVECINNTQFLGYTLGLTMAETEDSQILNLETVSQLDSGPFQSALDFGADSITTRDHGGESAGDLGGEDYHGKGGGSFLASVGGGGRGRGGSDSKPWQQEGDWPCPNARFVSDLLPIFRTLKFATLIVGIAGI